MSGFEASIILAVAGAMLAIFGSMAVGMIYDSSYGDSDEVKEKKRRNGHQVLVFILILASVLVAPAFLRLVVMAVLS